MSLSDVKDPSLGYFLQSPYFLPEELPHVGYPCLDGAFTERGDFLSTVAISDRHILMRNMKNIFISEIPYPCIRSLINSYMMCESF